MKTEEPNFYSPLKDGQSLLDPKFNTGNNTHGSKRAFELVDAYDSGFRKGMEIQNEIDRQEIERLKKEVEKMRDWIQNMHRTL